MKVFVVGAGGFIGSRICALLAACGHEVVRHVWEGSGDLTERAIPEGVEVLVNSAGRLGSPSVQMDDLRRANVEPARILAAASSRADIPLIHLSTPGVTGLVPSATEDLPPAPWGAYEETKAEAESMLSSAVPARLLTILRPDFVYGPGDMHKLAFFRQVARGWFPLVGKGSAKIRPTYVDDVARAVLAALPGGPLACGLFNIGGPEPVTVRQLAESSAEVLGTRLRILRIPEFVFRAALLLGPLGPTALSASRLALFGRDHYVDASRAAAAGFAPVTSLLDGLRSAIGWFRAEGLLP
jgi:nucleoside-diphosphate-sugar epimerase